MASSNRQINKPQRGRSKRAELPDVNINTGVQSLFNLVEGTKKLTSVIFLTFYL